VNPIAKAQREGKAENRLRPDPTRGAKTRLAAAFLPGIRLSNPATAGEFGRKLLKMSG
jgi:hypothetical protein